MGREKIALVWPEWEGEEQLGKGSYGTVYKAVRKDSNIQSYAAIKVISIPTDSSEVDSLRSEGLSMDGAKTYFKGIVDDFVGEIRLMESLKGVQNIVSGRGVGFGLTIVFDSILTKIGFSLCRFLIGFVPTHFRIAQDRFGIRFANIEFIFDYLRHSTSPLLRVLDDNVAVIGGVVTGGIDHNIDNAG